MYRDKRRISAEVGRSTIVVTEAQVKSTKALKHRAGADVQPITDQIDFRPNKAWADSVAWLLSKC
jgi:hypothetical protein